MSHHAPCTADIHEKRHRFLSRKALQNAIEAKRKELVNDARILQGLHDTPSEALEKGEHTKQSSQPLQTATQKYKETLDELAELYEQDQWGDYKEEAILTKEYSKLERPRNLIAGAAINHNHESSSQISQKSHRSSASRASSASRVSSSSSSARRRALAEAAATKKQSEYDKLIAAKESARRIREAEEQRQREQYQAQYELDMAILAADKAEAIANARLRAIEETLREEEDLHLDLPDIPNQADRIKIWVHAHQAVPYTTPHQVPSHRPVITSTPKENDTSGLLETFAATNQRLVSGLAKQSLPKCHPDVFNGEVTMFHPWRRAFKATIEDAEVSPA